MGVTLAVQTWALDPKDVAVSASQRFPVSRDNEDRTRLIVFPCRSEIDREGIRFARANQYVESLVSFVTKLGIEKGQDEAAASTRIEVEGRANLWQRPPDQPDCNASHGHACIELDEASQTLSRREWGGFGSTGRMGCWVY